MKTFVTNVVDHQVCNGLLLNRVARLELFMIIKEGRLRDKVPSVDAL